jgi:hypothetical protein
MQPTIFPQLQLEVANLFFIKFSFLYYILFFFIFLSFYLIPVLGPPPSGVHGLSTHSFLSHLLFPHVVATLDLRVPWWRNPHAVGLDPQLLVQPFATPLLAGPLRSPHCSHGAALLPLPDQEPVRLG